MESINIIISGPQGTGKTYLAERILELLEDNPTFVRNASKVRCTSTDSVIKEPEGCLEFVWFKQ